MATNQYGGGNFRNNYNNGYNNGGGYGYNNGGGNGYNNGGGNGSRTKKKKSGCGMKEEAKNGQPCIYGHRHTRQGRYSFVSSPRKKNNGQTKSPRWLAFVTTVTRPDGSTFFADTLWDTQKKRLKFTKGGQVANPYAANGGYWGRGGYKMQIRNR